MRYCCQTFASEADSENTFLQCSRCKGSFYSSREAQKAHWKLHKHTCSPPNIAEVEALSPRDCYLRLRQQVHNPLLMDGNTVYLIRKIRTMLEIKNLPPGMNEDDLGMELHTMTRAFFSDKDASKVYGIMWSAPGMTNYLLNEVLYSKTVLERRARLTNLKHYVSAESQEDSDGANSRFLWDDHECSEDTSTYQFSYLFYNLLIRTAICRGPSMSSVHDGKGILRRGMGNLPYAAAQRALDLWLDADVRVSCGDALAPAPSLCISVIEHLQAGGRAVLKGSTSFGGSSATATATSTALGSATAVAGALPMTPGGGSQGHSLGEDDGGDDAGGELDYVDGDEIEGDFSTVSGPVLDVKLNFAAVASACLHELADSCAAAAHVKTLLPMLPRLIVQSNLSRPQDRVREIEGELIINALKHCDPTQVDDDSCVEMKLVFQLISAVCQPAARRIELLEWVATKEHRRKKLYRTSSGMEEISSTESAYNSEIDIRAFCRFVQLKCLRRTMYAVDASCHRGMAGLYRGRKRSPPRSRASSGSRTAEQKIPSSIAGAANGVIGAQHDMSGLAPPAAPPAPTAPAAVTKKPVAALGTALPSPPPRLSAEDGERERDKEGIGGGKQGEKGAAAAAAAADGLCRLKEEQNQEGDREIGGEAGHQGRGVHDRAGVGDSSPSSTKISSSSTGHGDCENGKSGAVAGNYGSSSESRLLTLDQDTLNLISQYANEPMKINFERCYRQWEMLPLHYDPKFPSSNGTNVEEIMHVYSYLVYPQPAAPGSALPTHWRNRPLLQYSSYNTSSAHFNESLSRSGSFSTTTAGGSSGMNVDGMGAGGGPISNSSGAVVSGGKGSGSGSGLGRKGGGSGLGEPLSLKMQCYKSVLSKQTYAEFYSKVFSGKARK